MYLCWFYFGGMCVLFCDVVWYGDDDVHVFCGSDVVCVIYGRVIVVICVLF